jgi:opacity protein-like surface antigen
MRSKALILAVALLVLGVGAANAGTNWIGFSGGAGIPTGDFGNAASTGWHLGATGTHMMNDQWGIGGDLGYHAWGGSSDANSAAEVLFGPGSKFSYTAFQATAHAVMTFPTQSNVKPYANAGLGVYDIGSKLSSPTGDATSSDTKLGFNFGGGMNFVSSGNMRWGLDAAYHIVPDSNSNFDFFTLGVNLMWGLTSN